MGNTLRESAPGEFGGLRLVAGTIGFAQSSVTLDTLAIGDVVVQCWAQVLTAFNAATTNVLIAGNGVTADKFLAAADVTEGTPGVYPTGGKGPYTAETAAGSLVVAYSQTGTAATTGSARVYALVSSAAV
jgi:hypothetical protein